MKNFSKIFLFFGLCFVIIALTSCGKPSAPAPYEGTDYPHSYPRD